MVRMKKKKLISPVLHSIGWKNLANDGETWSDERLDALHQVNMADTKKVKKSEEKT